MPTINLKTPSGLTSFLLMASAAGLLTACDADTPVEEPAGPDVQIEASAPASLIDQAIADSSRPAEHQSADARRKASDLLAFAEIDPGDTIGDFIPGGGYWTRLFAISTGPTGTVVAFTPDPDSGQSQLEDIAADTDNYGNVIITPLAAGAPITSPEPLDVLWTSQNYHDLKNLPPPITTAEINAMLYGTLKPGGLYIIVDHSAAADAPGDVTDTLHRIREDLVREEVESAGFVFVESSDALRNSSDPLDVNVFDDAIRGNTDQFILKFRKPE